MESKQPVVILPAAAGTRLLDPVVTRAPREATVLMQLTRLTASNIALTELLEHVFRLLADMLPVDLVAIVERHDSTYDAVLLYPERSETQSDEREACRQLARAVMQAHGTVLQTPASERVLSLPSGGPVASRAMVGAPLIQQENIIGALVVEFAENILPLSEQDTQFLATIALQLGLVLERERAIEETRRRMDQMAAFSAVTSTVNEWVEVEQLARRFLLVFLNTTSTNYGLFYLLEGEDRMRVVGQYGVPLELHQVLKQGHLSFQRELERVVSGGRIVVLDQLDSDQIGPEAGALERITALHSAAILPLRAKGRAVGAIVLGRIEGKLEILDHEVLQGLADQAAQALENARLFNESQRRFQEQSALRELAQRFLSAVNPEEVIERTLDALATLLPGDFSEILLPDAEGSFVLVNGRGWRRGVVGRTRLVSDPHLHAGYVLRAQSPILVENFAFETRFQPAEHLARHQVAAGICAPMLAETRVIGLLGVYSRSARQFSTEQSHFLYLVATQTAMALEKARHSQSAQRRLDELILLNDVTVAANSQVSLDRVLDSITEEIGDLLQSDDVQIFFATEPEEKVQLRAALATARQGVDGAWARVFATWVLRSGEPMLIQDMARDFRFNSMALTVRAGLGVPMQINERVMGVIAVAHPEPGVFDNNDLRLLTTLAGQIAAAIERARLLDETAKRLAEITALFEFSNALRTATTEARLVEAVVHDAVSILQASAGSLQLLTLDGEHFQVVAVENMKHVGALIPRRTGGISWDVYDSGESLAVEDVMTDARIGQREVFDQVHGGVAVPLRTPSGVLGTLFVGFPTRGDPGSEKLRLATTIANLAAQALQRLRLNEQTVEQAASLAIALSELEESYQATLLALSAALDARDRATKGHSQRVTKWALAIGKELKLSPHELTSLEHGALLHDVGKIGISDKILLKAGPLTPDERELMNRHPELGFNMLKGIPFLQDALPVVLYHQEMYDGSGYPAGLRAGEIPLGARIFAVADTFDAMTSTRPYRKALSQEAALEEIKRCRATQFDPRVVDAFVALFARLRTGGHAREPD